MVGQQFTDQQRSFMVETYLVHHNIRITRDLFTQRFANRRAPCKKTILRNVAKYRAHGTSRNLNSGNSGRFRSGRSPRNMAQLSAALTRNPTMSSRRNDQANLTQSTFNRITRLDLSLHPYRIQSRFELLPGDPVRRLQYCNWLVQQPNRFESQIIISDEAHFAINGQVNVWNNRQYAERPPRNFVYDVPNNRASLTVWIGLVGDNTIIGPFFFHQNVNGQRYLDMLNNQVVPVIQQRYGMQRNGAIPRKWWFQDGAPAHRLRAVTTRLQELFPNRVISLGQPHEWPPRSPDLTPLDFFLWGYVKDRVYRQPPRNLRTLQQSITREIDALRRTRKVRAAVGSMMDRARLCIQLNGAQVEGRAAGQ